jgi:ribose transport system ATP-binding protein
MTPLISILNVTKRFPGVVALDDVSFDILPGELHAVVGENGAGKSTLMKILSGVIPDFEGSLLLRGLPVRFADTRAAEEQGISIIHQELNLVEDLSAAANIFLGREKRTRFGLLDDRAMERAAAALLVELECHVPPRQLVRTLRVGDQQLIEIAKALSLETDILIMDEPTSALTEAEVARLFRVIARLRERGVTILYISHKLDEVFRLADRITVLRDGRRVQTLARPETNRRAVTHLMVGREIESVDLGRGRQPGAVVLEVRNLSLPRRTDCQSVPQSDSRRTDWQSVPRRTDCQSVPQPEPARAWRLENISFTLRRGEILGIAGLMGAGRTELLECLFGASPEVPSGTMLLEGREVHFAGPAAAKAAGIAFVTEDRKRLGLFANLSVGANVSICTLDEAAPGGIVSPRRERSLAGAVIRKLGVKTAGFETAVTSLSGGNQQKAIIARWLLTRPKVLLLDDPTRGVDVGAKAELYRLMDQLCREGLGIVVTSSELPELLTLCDRILVLCEGRLTAEFSAAEATEQAIMEAATMRA